MQGCSPEGKEISTSKAEAKLKEFNVLKVREQLIPTQDHSRTGKGMHRAGSKDLLQIHPAGVVRDAPSAARGALAQSCMTWREGKEISG